ncbi:hypothetical protein LOK49_Contig298G00006 [Camellia lanceoleosa]|nr:hypothetical protein LOK49_Contig298G00006 [Camellia lanceoleosa]
MDSLSIGCTPARVPTGTRNLPEHRHFQGQEACPMHLRECQSQISFYNIASINQLPWLPLFLLDPERQNIHLLAAASQRTIIIASIANAAVGTIHHHQSIVFVSAK